MTEFLKKYSIQIFRLLLIIVLIGEVSNWIFNYSIAINTIINTAMFCLIGVAYLAFSWAFDKPLIKLVFAICGVYLIVMNFIPDFNGDSIIGIACILIPMIIGRFLNVEDDHEKGIME